MSDNITLTLSTFIYIYIFNVVLKGFFKVVGGSTAVTLLVALGARSCRCRCLRGDLAGVSFSILLKYLNLEVIFFMRNSLRNCHISNLTGFGSHTNWCDYSTNYSSTIRGSSIDSIKSLVLVLGLWPTLFLRCLLRCNVDCSFLISIVSRIDLNLARINFLVSFHVLKTGYL